MWQLMILLILGFGVLNMRGDMPRGIRNHNPGNIRFNPANDWQGASGTDDAGFVVFESAFHGLRALGKVLLSYRRRGLDTIAAIISAYAPAVENNTAAYINHAAGSLGVAANAPLSLESYPELMQVIVKHENGQQPYGSREFASAWSAARG